MQKGFASITIAILLLVLIGVGGAFFYLIQVKKQPEINESQKQEIKPSAENISAAPITQWQEKDFKNDQYKFSLSYPAAWDYKENDPLTPNLAEYTVTFFSPDQNTGLDVWVRSGNWVDVEQDVLKDKNATRSTVAEQPAIIQSLGANSKITFIKHPSLANKVLVFTSIGEDLGSIDQIQQTLKFE